MHRQCTPTSPDQTNHTTRLDTPGGDWPWQRHAWEIIHHRNPILAPHICFNGASFPVVGTLNDVLTILEQEPNGVTLHSLEHSIKAMNPTSTETPNARTIGALVTRLKIRMRQHFGICLLTGTAGKIGGARNIKDPHQRRHDTDLYNSARLTYRRDLTPSG